MYSVYLPPFALVRSQRRLWAIGRSDAAGRLRPSRPACPEPRAVASAERAARADPTAGRQLSEVTGDRDTPGEWTVDFTVLDTAP